ncbi:MAG: hypothetical protein KGJ66_06315 [Alphaproteobacteria bacterium]|nr:hypothetical protein [Alphaproteobacteria bacterium]
MRTLLLISIALFAVLISHSAVAQPRIEKPPGALLLYLCPMATALLGHITIRGDMESYQARRTGPANGSDTQWEESPKFFKETAAFAHLGLVSVIRDPAFQSYESGQSFNWNTFLQHSQGRLIDRVIVAATDAGRPYLMPGSNMVVRLLSCESTPSVQIVKVDYRQIGIDNYAAVFFTYTVDWNPLYVQYTKIINPSYLLKPHRKGIVLEQFDTFHNGWKIDFQHGFETANIDEPFQDHRIQDFLRQR